MDMRKLINLIETTLPPNKNGKLWTGVTNPSPELLEKMVKAAPENLLMGVYNPSNGEITVKVANRNDFVNMFNNTEGGFSDQVGFLVGLDAEDEVALGIIGEIEKKINGRLELFDAARNVQAKIIAHASFSNVKEDLDKEQIEDFLGNKQNGILGRVL